MDTDVAQTVASHAKPWHLVVLRVLGSILLDIPCFPLLIVDVICYWRGKAVIASLQDPNTTSVERRRAILRAFGRLMLDVTGALGVAVVCLTVFRAPTLWACLRRYARDEHRPAHLHWYLVAWRQVYHVCLDVAAALACVVATVLRFPWHRIMSTAEWDPEQRALVPTTWPERRSILLAEAHRAVFQDVPLALVAAVTLAVSPWACRRAWRWLRSGVNHRWHQALGELMWSCLVLDLPVVVLLVVFGVLAPWRSLPLVKDMWPRERSPQQRRQAIKMTAILAMLDLVCVLTVLLVVVTLYRLPGLWRALRERADEAESWQETVFRQFIPEEEWEGPEVWKWKREGGMEAEGMAQGRPIVLGDEDPTVDSEDDADRSPRRSRRRRPTTARRRSPSPRRRSPRLRKRR